MRKHFGMVRCKLKAGYDMIPCKAFCRLCIDGSPMWIIDLWTLDGNKVDPDSDYEQVIFF